MRALVDGRIALGRSITDLAALPEICAAQFLNGRRKRASELLVQELNCQSEEANARASLATAQKRLEALSPPSPPIRPLLDGGLTPAEIDGIVATLPEVSPETRETLLRLLEGRLEEKS